MIGISTVFFLVIGLVIVVSVIRLVRNLKLREKYAALWLFMGLIIVVLMLFPRLLDTIADWVGVATPVNLLFLIAIVLLLGVCLHLSLEISRLEDETRVLAEESAIQRSLLNQQLERIGRDRNPTASLPIIQVDENGRAREVRAHGSTAAGGSAAADRPTAAPPPEGRASTHLPDDPHPPGYRPTSIQPTDPQNPRSSNDR